MNNFPTLEKRKENVTLDGIRWTFPVSPFVLELKPDKKEIGPLSPPPNLPRRWGYHALLASCMIVVLASTFGTTYGKIGGTLSYFRDTELSTLNSFFAGLLDFVVTDNSYARTITASTTPIVIPVMTPGPGSLETLYSVTSEQTGGVQALCDALQVIATTSPFLYSGSLPIASTTATTTTGLWNIGFTLSTTTGLTNGDQCMFDLVYRGWYPTLPEYTGFTDEERSHVTITYEELPTQVFGSDFDVVLNEFLPNPHPSANGFNFGEDGDSLPFGEWVELYNKGSAPVDVLGWYMADASGGGGNTHAVIGPTNTNTGGTIIPAGGWIVVYMNKPTLGNSNAEEIHLFTDDNVEIDSVAYDNPSEFCENDITLGTGNASSSTASGTPGNGPSADCSQNQVAENKSYARFPDGTGLWYDPIPTPGEFNIVLPGDPLMQEPTAPSDESAGSTEPTVVEETEQATSTPPEIITSGEPVSEEPVVENYSPSGGAPQEIVQESSEDSFSPEVSETNSDTNTEADTPETPTPPTEPTQEEPAPTPPPNAPLPTEEPPVQSNEPPPAPEEPPATPTEEPAPLPPLETISPTSESAVPPTAES